MINKQQKSQISDLIITKQQISQQLVLQADIKMWYLKKTAQSVWNASKNFVDKRTPVQKLMDSIIQSQQQILSTTKLSQLSSMTYEVQTFDQIVEILFEKLKKFHYDAEESHKTLNLLVATNYLVKHGATGFVDQFRKYIGVFKKYEGLKSIKTYEDPIMQAKLDANLQKIKSRAHHIAQLLQNKQKLLKQKQLSMLVKQKLKLYEKNKLSELNNQKYSNSNDRDNRKHLKQEQDKKQKGEAETTAQNSKLKKLSARAQAMFGNPQELSIKLQGLLQSYVWKYVDKLDQTIQSASEKVISQIDKYVLGEHQPFQLEEAEKFEEDQQAKHQKQDKGDQHKDEDQDLMKRLEQEGNHTKHVQHADLLEFQQVKPKQPEKTTTQNQQLI